MKIYNTWLFIAILIIFTACESDDDSLADPLLNDVTATTYTSGSADFSNFVAVGNSLTAGFSDNALFIRGQEASFPNIMAKQFALAGGGNFTQPLMSDDVGGLLLGGVQIPGFGPRLIFDAVNQVPTPFPGTPTTDLLNPIPGPYNNMGVPGAKVGHLLINGFGAANPYYGRMASTATASVMEDAVEMNPTFFSLWIGNNDVLGYATSGGDGSNPLTPLAGPAGVGFQESYNTIVAQLVATGANGIIANIPNVTSAPFFTTVPYNPLDPSDPTFGSQVPLLNQTFAGLNQAFTLLGYPERAVVYSDTDLNPILIQDESLADLTAQLVPILTPVFGPGLAPVIAAQFGQSRQATSSDLVILPASTTIGTLNTTYFNSLVGLGVPASLAGQLAVNGITYPMEDNWVLIPSEQAEIATATEEFNTVIANAASTNDLAFFDANAFLNQVATVGATSGSVTVTDDFVTGGAFSLDGVHPSPRGYAITANEMISIINAKYSSNIPQVNPANYTGVYID